MYLVATEPGAGHYQLPLHHHHPHNLHPQQHIHKRHERNMLRVASAGVRECTVDTGKVGHEEDEPHIEKVDVRDLPESLLTEVLVVGAILQPRHNKDYGISEKPADETDGNKLYSGERDVAE